MGYYYCSYSKLFRYWYSVYQCISSLTKATQGGKTSQRGWIIVNEVSPSKSYHKRKYIANQEPLNKTSVHETQDCSWKMHNRGRKKKNTYFPMLSGSACKEMSLMERHVKFCNSGKLSGNLKQNKNKHTTHSSQREWQRDK